MLSTISQPFLNNNSKSNETRKIASNKQQESQIKKESQTKSPPINNMSQQQHAKSRPQALFAALRSTTSSAINRENRREMNPTSTNLNNKHYHINNNTNKYGYSFDSVFN